MAFFNSPSGAQQNSPHRGVRMRAITLIAAISFTTVVSCRDSATTAPSPSSALSPKARLGLALRARIPNGGTRADSEVALAKMERAGLQYTGAPSKGGAKAGRISRDVVGGVVSQFTCGISDYTGGTQGIALLAADPLFLGPLDATGLDALQDAYFAGGQPTCGPNVTSTTGYHQQSGIYMDPPGPDLNAGPLHFAFDNPVGSVAVLSAGVMTCAGNLGNVTAYDSLGTQIAQSPFVMRDSVDCGADSVSYGMFTVVAAPTVSIRSITINARSSLSFPVYLDSIPGDTITGNADEEYDLFFGPPGGAASTLSGLHAAGVNTNGSFITKPPESQINLQAIVTPGSLASSIKWFASDDPSDHVQTAVPSTIPDGSPSSFNVPVAQPVARYSAYSHPGTLDQKSLSLRVRAQVTNSAGALILSSDTATVRQDEIDTIREEYYELGITHGVPTRDKF